MSFNNDLRPIPVRTGEPARPSVVIDVPAAAAQKVLRNTYILLSMTLLFSAATVGLSMWLKVPALPWWANLIGMLGLLFGVHATRNSAWGLAFVFAFTGFIGFTTGPMLSGYLTFVPNGAHMVALSLGGTGAIFAALSAYAITSKKDFSFMGGFLLAGLVIVLLAGVANIFLHMQGLALAISVVSIGLFSALILFDTSRIIHGGETNYISATIALYLNLYNLFLSLLNLTGMTSDD